MLVEFRPGERESRAADRDDPAGDHVVLLVEDDANDAYLVSELLSQHTSDSYQIISVGLLAEASDLLAKQQFEVILVDLSLPDARGLDAVRRLQLDAPQTPIIVLSGNRDETVAVEAVHVGAQDYLVKGTVDGEFLHRSIRYAIERKRSKDLLWRMANYDPLTGLANRALFHERLSQAIARAKRSGNDLAVLLLDLDHFKHVNDRLGHDAGDTLLVEAVQRLQAAVREFDTVARLGGDEFAVIADGIPRELIIPRLAERIHRVLAAPLTIKDNEVVITTSIGIAVFPDGGETLEQLLKSADSAMYQAKKNGRNNCQFYSGATQASTLARIRLQCDLRHALRRDQFEIHYQPQLHLGDDRVAGVEALLRWRHPELGELAPAEFIPLLESTRLIAEVGEWVLRTACRQARIWGDAVPDLRLSVNLSVQQFEDDDLTDIIASTLAETGLPPGRLVVEITESAQIRDVQSTIRTLESLKKLGVSVAIDNFGAGHSSLAYLHRLPIDALKIDKSFIDDITDERSGAIASAVIALGHNLALDMVAVGIETAAQKEFLRKRGCDLYQGFLATGPLAPDELTAWLAGAT